jgi:hypothetical protein
MATENNVISKNVNEFSVSLFDNGFTLQYSGHTEDDNWVDTRLIVSDVEKLCELIRGLSALPRRL